MNCSEKLPLITTIIAVIILTALGAWQLKRLAWKNDLIHQIAERSALPSETITDCTHLQTAQQIQSFRSVHIHGNFDHAHNFYLYTGPIAFKGEAGYRLFTPFHCASAGTLLVDRGWIPADYRATPEKIYTPKGHTSIEGTLMTGEHPALFTPTNDAERNLWYWVDLPTMGKLANANLPPLYLMQSPESEREAVYSRYPLGRAISHSIRNDHLQYAITWFGIAIAAIVIYAVYAYQKKHRFDPTVMK
jgi:surfeit locus 1 family protein